MAKPNRVVWDTGVVIGLLEKVHGRYALIEPFIQDAEAGQLEILIPNTSVVELHGLKGLRDRGETVEQTREILQDFLSLPYVIRRPLHHRLADEAGELAFGLGIKRAADAVALAELPYKRVSTCFTRLTVQGRRAALSRCPERPERRR
jgi:predicted nucleic acid-binding protein